MLYFYFFLLPLWEMMQSSVFMFFIWVFVFLYIHHGYLVAAFWFGCTVSCLLWSNKCFLMPPMVEEMFSYASYGRRNAFLCLIRRRFTCAGFSLFYNFTILFFWFVGGTYSASIFWSCSLGWLTSAEYFHPSYFLYITNDFDLNSFANIVHRFNFLKIQSGLTASSPLGIISWI